MTRFWSIRKQVFGSIDIKSLVCQTFNYFGITTITWQTNHKRNEISFEVFGTSKNVLFLSATKTEMIERIVSANTF